MPVWDWPPQVLTGLTPEPKPKNSRVMFIWALCEEGKVECFTVVSGCFSLCVCVHTSWGAARTLHEVSLQESIRYAPGDTVEKWLNDLLCLDCLNITRIVSGCPLPEACELYPYPHAWSGPVKGRWQW